METTFIVLLIIAAIISYYTFITGLYIIGAIVLYNLLFGDVTEGYYPWWRRKYPWWRRRWRYPYYLYRNYPYYDMDQYYYY